MWRIARVMKDNPNESFAVHIQDESDLMELIKVFEKMECTIQFDTCEVSDLKGWMEEKAEEYNYDCCFRVNKDKEVAFNPSIEHWRVHGYEILEKRGHDIAFHNRDYTPYEASIEAEKILEQLEEDGDFIRQQYGFIADNITKEQMIQWLMDQRCYENKGNLKVEDKEEEEREEEDDKEMLETEEKYEPQVTVNYMLDLCQKLANAGYGDMVFKCNDGILHEDEIGCNYIARELTFRGFLFNDSIVQNMAQFVQSVKEAEEKFYRSMDKK